MPATPLTNGSVDVPEGYCACGCGLKTAIAFKTDNRAGWVKGQPTKFILGHSTRKAVRYIVNEATGCWEWQLNRDSSGYARMFLDRRLQVVHRVMYEAKYGSVPKGLELDHLCRNRGCVNPDHLEAVLPVTNARRGNQTKLTVEQVHAIRKKLEEGYSYRKLGALYHVHYAHIGKIAKRLVWREI